MSVSEKGHAKNVANFERLIDNCIGLGTAYSPAIDAIKVAAMQTLLAAANSSLSDVNSKLGEFKTAAVVRENAFKPLSIIASRVVNTLVAINVPGESVENAKSFKRKITGQRAKAAIKNATDETNAGNTTTESETETHNTASSSQLSFDNRLDNFDKLIKLLVTITQYKPNEADLKVTALTTLYNDMKTKNSEVMTKEVALANARIARNNVMYKENTGLVEIANSVKAYIKAAYGPSGVQFKQVSKLSFTTAK